MLLPVEICKDFEDKCTNLHLSTDKAIEMLIEDWILLKNSIKNFFILGAHAPF